MCFFANNNSNIQMSWNTEDYYTQTLTYSTK